MELSDLQNKENVMSNSNKIISIEQGQQQRGILGKIESVKEECLTEIPINQLKSRQVLSDLLNEQIEANQQLTRDNDTLIKNQRKLLQLLQNRDETIDDFQKVGLSQLGDSSLDTTTINISAILHDHINQRKDQIKTVLEILIKKRLRMSMAFIKSYAKRRGNFIKGLKIISKLTKKQIKLYYQQFRSLTAKKSICESRKMVFLSILANLEQNRNIKAKYFAFRKLNSLQKSSNSIENSIRFFSRTFDQIKRQHLSSAYYNMVNLVRQENSSIITQKLALQHISQILVSKQNTNLMKSIFQMYRTMHGRTKFQFKNNFINFKQFSITFMFSNSINRIFKHVETQFKMAAFNKFRNINQQLMINHYLKESNIRRGLVGVRKFLQNFNRSNQFLFFTRLISMSRQPNPRLSTIFLINNLVDQLNLILLKSLNRGLKNIQLAVEPQPEQTNLFNKLINSVNEGSRKKKSDEKKKKIVNIFETSFGFRNSFRSIEQYPDQEFDSADEVSENRFFSKKPTNPRKVKLLFCQKRKTDLIYECKQKLNQRLITNTRISCKKKQNEITETSRQFMFKTQEMMKNLEIETTQQMTEQASQIQNLHAVEVAYQSARNEVEELRRYQRDMENKFSSQQVQVQEIRGELFNEKQKQQDFERQLNFKEGELEVFKETNERLQKDKQTVLKKLEQSFHTLRNLKNQYEDVKSQLTKHETEKRLLFQDLQAQDRDIDNLNNRINELENSLMHQNHMQSQSQSPIKNPGALHHSRSVDNSNSVFGMEATGHGTSRTSVNGNASNAKMAKFKREIEDLKFQLENLNEEYLKVKSTNIELTQEAIALNEDQLSHGEQMKALQKQLNDVTKVNIELERKIQILLKNLDDLKFDQSNKDSVIHQLNEDQKILIVDNNNLKQEIFRVQRSLDSQQKKKEKQFIELEHENNQIKNRQLGQQHQVHELNETVANLNREQVNLLREMTLIHDKGLQFEQENQNLQECIEQYQFDIEEYKQKLDSYAIVMKSMDDKIRSLQQISLHNLKQYREINNGPTNKSSHRDTQQPSSNNFQGKDKQLLMKLENMKNQLASKK